jgi:hypothetical protein
MNAITSAAATPTDRAEISRRNGARSRGPRTPEGKDRSKFNALKHGMTAKTLVLPGEDPARLQLRIDTWTGDLQPGNATERYLVERAAAISWQLDRADRADAARLAARIRNDAAASARRERAEVEALGRRLFHGPQASFAAYVELELEPHPKPRDFGASALAADPNHPATLVFELASTAAGCQWLLERWAELRHRWLKDQDWSWLERFRALRLLGKQTLGVQGDPIIDAILPVEFRAEDSVLTDDVDDAWEETCRDELEELLDDEEADDPSPKATAPSKPVSVTSAEAVAQLISTAIARLEALAREHRLRALAGDAEDAARMSFDSGDEAERLRRYQVACNRNLLRTLDAFFKVRARRDESEPSARRALDLDARRSSLVTESALETPGPDPAPVLLDTSLHVAPSGREPASTEASARANVCVQSCIHSITTSPGRVLSYLDPEPPLESITIVPTRSPADSLDLGRALRPQADPDSQIRRNEPGITPSEPPATATRLESHLLAVADVRSSATANAPPGHDTRANRDRGIRSAPEPTAPPGEIASAEVVPHPLRDLSCDRRCPASANINLETCVSESKPLYL